MYMWITDGVKMCQEKKKTSGAWGTVECVIDAFYYILMSTVIYYFTNPWQWRISLFLFNMIKQKNGVNGDVNNASVFQ